MSTQTSDEKERIALSAYCYNGLHAGCHYPDRCGCPCHAATELKPCPFCGSDSVIWSDLFQRVRCNGCFMGTSPNNPAGARTEDSTATLKSRCFATWNTRHSQEREQVVVAMYQALGRIEALHVPMKGESTADPNTYCALCVGPNGRSKVFPCQTATQARAAIAAYENQE